MKELEKIRPQEIVPNVFHLHFPSKYIAAATFLRFQEYYESPKFKGKIFSREEFEDWYASERGNFTYTADWGGFNIPSRVLAPFQKGKFDPLYKKEQWLLDQFAGRDGKFYIIGTSGEVPPPATLRHEIGHGLFYTSRKYKRRVLNVIKGINPEPIHAFLGSRAGYHPSVFDDETHAYVLASLDMLLERKHITKRIRRQLRPAERHLVEIFHEFAPEY